MHASILFRWRLVVFVVVFSLLASFFGPAQVMPVAADKAGVCGPPGKDGPGTPSGVINTYYPGAADVAAGATSIPVGTRRAGGGPDIERGDLLLVIQVQGADIDSSNDERYGDGVGGAGVAGDTVVYSAANAYAGGNVSSNFSAGTYEYVVAAGPVAAGFVPLTSNLVNNYFRAGFSAQGQRRFQVVRIPQYSNAALGGTVTALAWDGETGGIVAMDVAGELDWAGQAVDVGGQGFRGGGGRELDGDTGSALDYRTLSTDATNGSKGEGYAGTPRFLNNGGALLDMGVEGYPGGSYGRGAAGNAGGGSTDGNPSSNDENSGGGGGGNGGFGGKGGNAWDSALVVGGFGGAPFPGSAPRLILGGGGGAGTTNNGTGTGTPPGFASSGATGGGVVMIRSGTIVGAGNIDASGDTANSTVLNDGGGGGGAGGSVVVIARNGGGSVGSLTVDASGGDGGDVVVTGGFTHHGPGGGGGGGFIFTSGSLDPASSVAGGIAGITSGTTPAPTPQNFGATNGGLGSTNVVTPDDIPTSISGANCVPVTPVIVKTTSTPVLTQTATGVIGEYTINVSIPVDSGWALGLNILDTLPNGAPGTITYRSTSNISVTGLGSERTSAVDPTPGAIAPSWGVFDIASGGSVTITFTVDISAAVPLATYQNPVSATFLDPVRTTPGGTTGTSYDWANDPGEDIQLVNVPVTPTSPPPGPTSTPAPPSPRATQVPALPVSLNTPLIPVTGFAPNQVSRLPFQSQERAYRAAPGLSLKIPTLGVDMPIVGVPFVDNTWDVSWLGESAGYLDGTAYPTWSGNSVITGHVTGADGKAGPFATLGQLKPGDRIVVYAYGQAYIYEVRTVYLVKPTSARPFEHKDESWITLVTCKFYDRQTDTYKYRTIVQAVLIGVDEQTLETR